MDLKPEPTTETQVLEAEPPTGESPLLALLEGPARRPPDHIPIPAAPPDIQARINAIAERREAEVNKARERAYSDDPHAIPPPILDKDLSPEQLAWLNELRAEWDAWHADPANAHWRPSGGPGIEDLDVSNLVAGTSYRRPEGSQP